jgi:type IV pilus assembly protein PilE
MKRTESGFTLIELMIALVILGTLAALAYPAYTSIIKDNHLKKARANILQIEQSMERYYTQKSTYTGAIMPAAYAATEKFNFTLSQAGACDVADGVGADKYCIVARPNADWDDTETRFLVREGHGEVFICSAEDACIKTN